MGCKAFGANHTSPCWIKDGYVYTKLYSGTVVSYETALPFDVEEQTNYFDSNRVAFVLFKDESMIVGRLDGTIGIFDKDSGLLTGLNWWKCPGFPLTPIGYTYGAGANRFMKVFLDLRDGKTIYCGDYIALVKEPLPKYLDLNMALVCAKSGQEARHNCFVCGEDGELIAFDAWSLQDVCRVQNNKVKL